MNKLLRDYLPVIFCVFLSFTQLNVYLPFINSLAIMFLGLILSFLYYKGFYKQSLLGWLCLYAVVLLVNNFIGDYYFKLITNVAEEICVLVFPAALSYFIITHKKYKMAVLLVYSFFFLIIYSAIASFIVCSMFPDPIRTSVFFLNQGEMSTLNLYYGMGMVTYKFCHALPIVIPALLYSILRSNKSKTFKITAFATLISLLLIVYLSNATTAFLLTLYALAASLFVSEKSLKATIFRIIGVMVVFVLLVIRSDLLVDLINSIGSLLPENENSYLERLNDIKLATDSGNISGDLDSRVSRYNESVSVFVEDIFFGSNMQTGEHSAILDRLACLGLVGWIPYLVYIVKNTLSQNYLLQKEIRPYFVIGASVALLLLATKNMSYWDTWFMYFCLLPVLLWLSSLDQIEVE